ncbi:hypothetical protein JTF08_01335 [Micrococcaceae bacterium RIT802]|nr:hypothetical protein [Micrococcaceae bacterium RIT 802]
MEYRPLLRRRTRADRRPALARLELDLLDEAATGTDGTVEAFPEFLDYLAATGRYIFHGSNRRGITEFRTQRESSDASALGRQQAVFGTHDPHWAMFYALVDRGNAFLIANASVALRRSSRLRWYRRTVFASDPETTLLTAGRLYVLPRAGFVPEARKFGLLDTAQWISACPAWPLFSLPVSPAAYPPARFILRHPSSSLPTRWQRQ